MVSTRLTDQALVAVTVSRARAEVRGDPASVADLVVGLATEPDGAAGHVLRDRSSAAGRLADLRPPSGIATLDLAVAEAAAAAAPRPAATLDLLYAAIDVGGNRLVTLLTETGWDLEDLRAVPPGPAGETLGLRGEPRLAPGAAAAVAHTRARAGGAVELLYELAEGPDADDLALDLPAPQPATDPGTDAGLGAVLDAARRFRPDGTITSTDLVRATIVAGGTGPRALLEGDEDG